MSARQLRRDVSAFSTMLFDQGFVANHDGNVSARIGRRVLVTPTGISKRLCSPDSIVECDESGKPVGAGRPPSEMALHLGAYAAREDAGAVIHAHPPHASAFALAQVSLSPVVMPEVFVSIGEHIPVVPLFAPKDPNARDAVGHALAGADVLLLAGNGVLTIGPDLETAYLRLELVEHYAKIVSIARSGVGALPALPPSVREKLIALRKGAGLWREASASSPAVGATDSVRQVVAEEVRRALEGSKR